MSPLSSVFCVVFLSLLPNVVWTQEVCVCGTCGIISAETDTTIYSHSTYANGQNYPNNHQCSDRIEPPVDKCAQVDVVYLQLNRFSDEYNHDYLYFVDNLESGDEERGAFTNELSDNLMNHLPDRVYGLEGVPLTLRFETDGSMVYDGYELTVRVGECAPAGPPTCECGSASCSSVGGVQTEVISPNYPFSYEDYTNAFIDVTILPDTFVRITVKFFWTEFCCDFVAATRDGVEIDRLRGFLQPGAVYEMAGGSPLRLTFHSDYSEVFPGFAFIIDFPAEIDDCVGVTCSGNGDCVDGFKSFTCDCHPAFAGELCEIPLCGQDEYFYDGLSVHCYKLVPDVITWQGALDACAALDPVSYLVQLETQAEMDFVRPIVDLAGGRFWTSGHMSPQQAGANWHWGDGSVITFFSWGQDQPVFSKGWEFCMELSSNKNLGYNEAADKCDKGRAFICEWAL